jgi:hemolysin-activating ACP:hemolysin acyltransferase
MAMQRHQGTTETAFGLPSPSLQTCRPDNPAVALGLAVNYLMSKPAFANLRFGDWSRILVGQINRSHYCFVIDGQLRVQGFAGWALTTREKAEAWIEGQSGLGFEDSRAGDCVVFNAWSANSRKVHRYMVDEARKLVADKQTIYFKRHYKDGSIRPVRLAVNDFVAGHISRKESAPTAGSAEMRPVPNILSPISMTRSGAPL